MYDMKILFCGQMKSPFILQDLELLEMHYPVECVNLNIIEAKREGPIEFAISLFTTIIPKIRKNDVVYIWFATYPALPLIALSKFFGKRTILTIGGWEIANFPEIGYGNQLNPIHGAITRWCLRNANTVLIPSESYKQIALLLEPSANVCVVPNAIDKSLCEVPIVNKINRAVTALYTLQFTQILKGIPTFEAAALKIYPFKCEVYEQIPHDKLMEILRQSKVYCQLSYTESFGVTNLEAMACGCVPVVTNRDAMPEIIDGVGIVVPYGDADATAYAIKVAMHMDGNLARERAKIFTRETRIKMLSDIIENNNPLVSVVIPSYNAAKWLPETIQSILNQTYKNIEIIIVDDCSTDNTEELIKNKYPLVQYFKNTINRGECFSSNKGFQFANGKYICRLSADDMYANINKIKSQVNHMERTNADWSYNATNYMGNTLHDAKRIDSFWMIIPIRFGGHKISQLLDNIFLTFPRVAFLRMFVGNPINSSTLMIRKTSYIKYDKWTTQYRTDCDGKLLFSLLLRGTKGLSIREVGSLYRTHPDQTSYNPGYIKDMKDIREGLYQKVITGDYPLWLKIAMRLMKRWNKI